MEQTKALGYTGLVESTGHSTLDSTVYAAEAKESQQSSASLNQGASATSSSGLSSLTGFSSTSAGVGNIGSPQSAMGMAHSAAPSGSGTFSAGSSGGSSGSDANAGAGQGSGSFGTTNLQVGSTGSANGSGSGSVGSSATHTAGHTVQYMPGANGGFIPFDTNSGKEDPNIKAGAAASKNAILKRAGKYAR